MKYSFDEPSYQERGGQSRTFFRDTPAPEKPRQAKSSDIDEWDRVDRAIERAGWIDNAIRSMEGDSDGR